MKINFARQFNTTPKELKTEWDCSHRQLFAIIAALQYGVTTRESSVKKKTAHSDLSPNLELTTPTEDRIMPCHVSPGGQEATCQVDVSRRKYE